jgi:drug/metabolite transporter (DMT)-like permease
LWIKIALRGLSPTQVVLGQLVTGAAVLVAVVALRRLRLPRTPAVWGHLAVMATVGGIAPYFLFSWGEQHIASSLAGVLNATTPLVTLLLVLALRSERITGARVAGIVLGLVGVLVLAAPWRSQHGDSSIMGIGACLLAASCYAVGYVYARRFLTSRGIAPLLLATGQLGIGALVLGVAAPVVLRQPMILSPGIVAAVLMLGVLSTDAAYVLNYRLIQDEGAAAASTANFLIPVVAVTLGVVLLAEPMSWNLIVGAVIVLAGVALADSRPSLEAPTPCPEPEGSGSGGGSGIRRG